jgi:hypothetical protein
MYLSYQLLNAWTNLYETWYVYHGTWANLNGIIKQLGRTNRLLSLIRRGPHLKRRVQQCFYCCLCIRYRGNVSTQPVPSNDKGIFTEPLSGNDKRTYTKPLPSNGKEIHRHTHTETLTWSYEPILFFFFKISKVGGPSTSHDTESDAGGSFSFWQGHPSR